MIIIKIKAYFWDGSWNSTIVIALLVFCTISLKYDIKKPLPFWHVFYCKFVPFFSVIKKIPVCMWNVPIWARFCPMKIWQGSEQRISHNHNCFVITPRRKIKLKTKNKMRKVPIQNSQLGIRNTWYFVTKIVLTYCEKKNF